MAPSNSIQRKTSTTAYAGASDVIEQYYSGEEGGTGMSYQDTENLVDWMMLEAKASREGLPIHPEIQTFALRLEAIMVEAAQKMARILDGVEIDKKPKNKEHFWRCVK